MNILRNKGSPFSCHSLRLIFLIKDAMLGNSQYEMRPPMIGVERRESRWFSAYLASSLKIEIEVTIAILSDVMAVKSENFRHAGSIF